VILPPTEAELLPFLALCVRRGDVRDVRKMKAAQDDDAITAERRAYLAAAQQRSRARRRSG